MIIFISGTGTDVGKSFVNMELNALLMQKGYKIISIKPIETGIQGNLSLEFGNSFSGNHFADLVNRHKARTQSPLSLCRFTKNYESTTAIPSVVDSANLKSKNNLSLRDSQRESKQSTLCRHTEQSEVSKTRESNEIAESMTENRINELDSHLQQNDSYNLDSQDLDSSLRTSASLRMTESGIDSPCDAQLHAQNQSEPKKINEICFYRFSLPAAPFVADFQGIIDIDFLKNKIKALEKECDILLVEGAGGLFVPIKKDYFFIDLINDLGRESRDLCKSAIDLHKSTLDSPKSNPNSTKSKLLCALISHDKLGCIDAILSHREALERRNIDFISIVNIFNESQFMQISYPFLRDLKRNFIFQHQKREILEFILHFMKS